MSEPKIIQGGAAIDDRGVLKFNNDFKFDDVKRFYIMQNHQPMFVRAWHAHKNESKYIMVIHGTAMVCAVKIDDWDAPSKNLPVFKVVLSELSPNMAYIPAGYANGIMTYTQDTKVVIYSDKTLDESKRDDVRYDARYWNPWKVEER